MRVKELKKRMRLLELINDAVLPATTLGAILSALTLNLTFLFGVSAICAISLYIARQYIKRKGKDIKIDLEKLKDSNKLSDKEYKELKRILNKLTISRNLKKNAKSQDVIYKS